MENKSVSFEPNGKRRDIAYHKIEDHVMCQISVHSLYRLQNTYIQLFTAIYIYHQIGNSSCTHRLADQIGEPLQNIKINQISPSIHHRFCSIYSMTDGLDKVKGAVSLGCLELKSQVCFLLEHASSFITMISSSNTIDKH